MLLQLGVPTVVVSSAEAAREFLKTHDIDCCSRPPLVGLGKFSYNHRDIGCAPYGDYWREVRKICVLEVFSTKRVQSFQFIREEEVTLLIDSIAQSSSSGSPIDLTERLMSLTANIICRIAFGKSFQASEFGDGRFQEVVDEAVALLGGFTAADFFPYVGRICKSNHHVTEGDVDQLHYLKMVVKETLRLHPPAPLLVPRETMSHFEINGYHIYPKTQVHVNVWAIGRDPNLWKNPEEFLPERFMDNSVDFRGQHFELLPFGAGRRICLGMYMAIATVELALANLLYRFNWNLPNGMREADINMEEAAGLTVRKKFALNLVPILHHYFFSTSSGKGWF
ncbi:hypothetical protein AAG906_040869 [Vitis piasezkii]